ncbi:MAG: hypothetical protein JRH20_16375 [Deltaproteobacteria bacterium]|nr:hypothetical protein [Deltaproteobacteria bacterium]
MSALGYHMVCRLKNNRVIATTPLDRLTVTRIVLQRGRPFRLLVFRLVDTHLHFEVAEPLHRSMELARRIEVAISNTLYAPRQKSGGDLPVPAVGFAPAFPKEIRDQSHLFNVFDYILRQRDHHGLSWDARAEASNLPDLLGLRFLGGNTDEVVQKLLPRVTRRFLIRHLGVDQLEPVEGPLVAPIRSKLHSAVCALASVTTLLRRTRIVRAAQVAAVNVAGHQLCTQELADTLEILPRTVQRMRKEQAKAEVEHALRLQLALHAAVEDESDGVFSGLTAS